jgi:hypothetical protein
VDQEQSVKQKHIGLFASVLLVDKATHWYLVRKLDALPIPNVPLMKNVTISLPQAQRKNANPSA